MLLPGRKKEWKAPAAGEKLPVKVSFLWDRQLQSWFVVPDLPLQAAQFSLFFCKRRENWLRESQTDGMERKLSWVQNLPFRKQCLPVIVLKMKACSGTACPHPRYVGIEVNNSERLFFQELVSIPDWNRKAKAFLLPRARWREGRVYQEKPEGWRGAVSSGRLLCPWLCSGYSEDWERQCSCRGKGSEAGLSGRSVQRTGLRRRVGAAVHNIGKVCLGEPQEGELRRPHWLSPHRLRVR